MQDDDPDRAAILARRLQFIALALSGLTGAACAKGSGEDADSSRQPPDSSARDSNPQVCLSMEMPEATPTTEGGQATTGDATGDAETETAATETGEAETGEAETGGTETGEPTPLRRRPKTRPKPPPQPCLQPVHDPDPFE